MTMALASPVLVVYKSFEISCCTTCNTWCLFERMSTQASSVPCHSSVLR